MAVQVLTKEWVRMKLPRRPQDANKGTFGKVLVVAGSENYPGAAYLACAAAYRVGAGLVTLSTEPEVKIIVSRKLPEVTFLPRSEVVGKMGDYEVLLVGPGLGQSNGAMGLVKKLLNIELPPLVVDGDGLNILSKTEDWWDKLNGEVVLTPHPGELSRLTGLTIKKIQSDRVNIAVSFAKKWGMVMVLKGANTVVVSPAGGVLVSPFANPVLSTAGTGDVLAGAIAGMMAQGLDALAAAGVSAYIHGAAGENLRAKVGNAGGLASDLLPLLPLSIKEISIKK